MKALDALNITDGCILLPRSEGSSHPRRRCLRGWGRMELSCLAANGHLERVGRAVYRTSGAPSMREETVWAIRLSLEPAALAHSRDPLACGRLPQHGRMADGPGRAWPGAPDLNLGSVQASAKGRPACRARKALAWRGAHRRRASLHHRSADRARPRCRRRGSVAFLFHCHPLLQPKQGGIAFPSRFPNAIPLSGTCTHP